MSRSRGNSLLLLLAAVSFWLTGEVLCDRLSGLYVDNGYDQTVVHRVMTKREKRKVEYEILDLLGLPDRPPKQRNSTQAKRSVPKFLLDIYKNALENENGSEFELSSRDLRAIDRSDVIITFAARNQRAEGTKHKRNKRLWFDVSEVPPNEHVINAELRLYRSLENIEPGKNLFGSFTLTVYRILGLKDGERELQYVNAVNASADHEGWLSINVDEALRHWLENPASNRGLYLSVHRADAHAREMKLKDVGIVGLNGAAEKQPFLVGYFESSGKSRNKRTRTKRNTKRRRRIRTTNLNHKSNPLTDPPIKYSSRSCNVQTLYVSFRDLEWQDWIVAPDGYDAFYCSGECDFPLNAHVNATNHAIIQTLVHLIHPERAPKPCCAPNKLAPISVLYYLDKDSVILKKYKNMIVKNCGCQ